MGVNSLPKTVTRQRRGCDLNPGPTAPESSTLTARLPSKLASNKCSSEAVASVASMDENLPIEQSQFFSTSVSTAVNEVNYQQTLQREAF